MILSIFSYTCWPFAFPLWKNVVFCPFSNQVVVCLFDVELHELFIYVGY